MSKIYVPLPSNDNLDLYLHQGFDGFVIGIKKYSSNFNNLVDYNDLETIIEKIKKTDKKIFIALNRLYYNEEIESVKELVKKLQKLNIDGIGYTDLGLLNILNELNYDKEIIWLSNHLGTNSKTINFLEKRNVDMALLSTEINIDEILSIKKNTNIKIGVKLYGFLNMATSSRQLLSNYFEFINEKKEKNLYNFKEKRNDDKFLIVEEKNTNFFTYKVLNGINYFPILLSNNIDFIFLDNYLLNEVKFYNVIEAYSSLRNAPNDKKFLEALNKVVIENTFYDTFDGFLNKKTVVKVADYE